MLGATKGIESDTLLFMDQVLTLELTAHDHAGLAVVSAFIYWLVVLA